MADTIEREELVRLRNGTRQLRLERRAKDMLRTTTTTRSRQRGPESSFVRGRAAWRGELESAGVSDEQQVVGESCISVSERQRDRLVELIRN